VFQLWVRVLLGASLLAGCSGDDPSSYERGVSDICHGACVGWQRCGISDGSCESNCVANYDPRGMRGDSLSKVGQCLERESCDTLASDEPFSPCFDQAATLEPLRDELLAYCEDVARGYFNCNIWWSVEDCTHTMGLWNDDVLKAAALCLDHNCPDISGCEKATFENPP
jgi:hypothetical protein